jgi:hypothetical protein
MPGLMAETFSVVTAAAAAHVVQPSVRDRQLQLCLVMVVHVIRYIVMPAAQAAPAACIPKLTKQSCCCSHVIKGHAC